MVRLTATAALLLAAACGGPTPEPTAERLGPCTSNVDPGMSVHTCRGDDLLWCVCDALEDNRCPSREGHWVVQDIRCTCDEWNAGRCPVE